MSHVKIVKKVGIVIVLKVIINDLWKISFYKYKFIRKSLNEKKVFHVLV